MDFRSKQIPPPKYWPDFEDLCLALFQAEWNDQFAQKNGRTGQPQCGVDVFGSPSAIRDVFHGVQCKGKDRGYGSKATVAELIGELAKAESFAPRLEHWVFATSASRDEKLQKAARELSVSRKSKGQFTVTVLGWEDIQSMLSRHPNVVEDFYPEHAFDLPGILRELRQLPSGENLRELLALLRQSTLASRSQPTGKADVAFWDWVTFDQERDLGPALLGRALGPADAAACPRLVEVDLIISQLRRAFYSRLIGEPGTGKSVCAYQVASDFYQKGWRVYRLRGTNPGNEPLPLPIDNPTLLLIDDAHLLGHSTLSRLEEAATNRRLVLSIHNGVEDSGNYRGAVSLDPKRAVHTIASALLANPEKTLAAVRRTDDEVGVDFLKVPLERRVSQAEEVADRPWQFCFILGGGWRRAREATDSARMAGADLVLAAAAIVQVACRDATLEPSMLIQFCTQTGISVPNTSKAIDWLVSQRLMISTNDCRCPHQRFAIVALGCILDGQDDQGRTAIGSMLERVVGDSTFPLGGLRILLHELRFHGSYGRWAALIGAQSLGPLIARCWTAASAEDRAFAALILSDMDSYLDDWPESILANRVAEIANWISTATPPTAYGLFALLNALRNKRATLATEITNAVDPLAIGAALSAVTAESASHLAELLKAIGWARTPDWITAFNGAFDRTACLALATSWPSNEPLYSFERLCFAISQWDEALGLTMAECFVPTAQAAFAENPVSAFQQLEEIASYVLRVSDPLGVFVGRLRPIARHLSIAKAMCAKLKPALLAAQLSATPKRDFQTATFFLAFLRKAFRAKFDATIEKLDWKTIEQTIGDSWRDLPHDAEIFLTVGYSNKIAREALEETVWRNLYRIEDFSPRVAALVPKAAFKHVESGKVIRLTRFEHCEWEFGAAVVAQFAQERPDLLETLLAPAERACGAALSGSNASWYRRASMYLEVLREAAPTSFQRMLDGVDVNKAKPGWIESLEKGGEPRRTVAILVEEALRRSDSVGDLARSLRKRFPKKSIPKRSA